MEVIENLAVVEALVAYWEKQNIRIAQNSLEVIHRIEEKIAVVLPDDFKEFYLEVNGMNKADRRGFLIYPLQAILPVKKVAAITTLKRNSTILIFAEYKKKTWYYGIQLKEDGDYTIGLVTKKGAFKPITNFLAEFIDLYLEDSSKLYDGFELYDAYEEHMMM
ncbi:MAG TPA: SMI1/KNR4 family protein [Bacteroidia bacterium]|jgi:hypothetical protein|nr:SMI1/KNR4 family protein [Bacteroidia bacterium]